MYRSHTLLGCDVEMQNVLTTVDMPVVVACQLLVGEAPSCALEACMAWCSCLMLWFDAPKVQRRW